MTTFLSWWTSKETDVRKVLLWNAMQNREKLLALLREAYEAGQQGITNLERDAARYDYLITCDYIATKEYLPERSEAEHKAKARAKHDAAIDAARAAK